MKTKPLTHKITAFTAILFPALIFTFTPVQAATLTIEATANIYGAGHASPPAPSGGGAGILPPSISFPAAPGQVLMFSDVTGMVDYGGVMHGVPVGAYGPDGFDYSIYEIPDPVWEMSPWDGISGHRARTGGVLMGVFLDDSEPTDPAPPRLDFTPQELGMAFTNLSPAIGQCFFIGDGLTGTGTGAVQRFLVPPTATRLFLGFSDSMAGSTIPGGYDNNTGSLLATFTVGVPGPLLSIQVADVDICWLAESNRSYQLEYRSSLTTNMWMPLGMPIIGTGSRTCIVESIREFPQKFYRVRELP